MAVTGGSEPELVYQPVLSDASAFLGTDPVTRFLLIGEGLDEGQGLPSGFESVAGSRFVTRPEVELPTGNYRFRHVDGDTVMLVTDGSRPGTPAWARRTADRTGDLDRAESWFEHLWATAAEIPLPMFSTNEAVHLVADGREAQIRGRRFEEGRWHYRVRVDRVTQNVAEAAIAVEMIDDDPHDWVTRIAGVARQIAATLTRAKLTEQLTDTVYSFRATRTIYRPYQFRPIIKLLRTGRHRLLIADEVGLGKTIEAGLIWTEFDARGQADRVLVVCPSMLVPKWRAEMNERFGYEVTELDAAGLDEMLGRAEHDRLPPRFRAICSLERLRVWEGLGRLNDLTPRFDLVIVDEAHAVRNTGTRSHTLGCLLADWAEALVFLSATPLNLGNDDLFNLLQLLEPGEFDDRQALQTRLEPNAVLNRLGVLLARSGSDANERSGLLQSIGQLAFGRAVISRPEFTALEQLMAIDVLSHAQIAEARGLISRLHTLSTVINRTRKVDVDEEPTIREARTVLVELTPVERRLYDAVHEWQAARASARGMALHFVGQMKLRLAGSCLPAMRDQILSHNPRWGDLSLEPDEVEVEDDRPPASVVNAAEELGDVDTKYDEFEEALERIVEQGRRVLVFSFSRPTVAYLERRLSGRFRVAVLHGGIRSRDRQDVIARFRRGEFDVLVASRVASEGLDFEFCGAVVNYDLPWNPMEVEQRIGRIDRFGQEEDVVYVVNLLTPGTIEADIVSRVHERIGVFSASIGELEPILGPEMSGLWKVAFDFDLSKDQKDRKVDQILTAVETKARIQTEVEEAFDYLNVLDDAEIDGFEDEIVKNGRYVGQPELVWLLEDWAASSPGASCEMTEDRTWVRFRGNSTLEDHLLGVEAAGERSATEVASLAADLRNEAEIVLCLDQETARRQGADLLSSTHPLVRAALRAPGSCRTKFGRATVSSETVESGTYLVLVGMARWNGVREATEFWTAATDMTGAPVGDGPGDALLAALAEARIGELEGDDPEQLTRALRVSERQLARRLEEEGDRRRAENTALAEARRISIRETHERKLAQIRGRIRTLQIEGKPKMIPLFESQLRVQEHKLAKAEQELDEASVGSMSIESVAVCILEVT